MWVIKDSQVHGKGLFAAVDIPANTRIADYNGIEMTLKDFKLQHETDYRCTYRMQRVGKIINGKGIENAQHYCNESLTPNLICKKKGLYTVAAVKAGNELFLRYFKEYPRDYELKA